MILPDSYTPTSLQSQISELSDPRTEVTPVRVANLVTQYFVAFLLEKSGIEIYTSDEVEDLYHAATANLLESRLLGDDSTMTGVVGISCRWATYALSMLIDTAATTHMIEEILTAPTPQRKRASILELGAGSGIPLVAGVIRARRQGSEIDSAIGIEIESLVAKRANILLQKLSIGEVRTGNTMDRSLYTTLPSLPTIILNENLSTSKLPLLFRNPESKREIYEPFLDNLYHLHTTYGDDLSDSYHFPRETQVSSLQSPDPLPIPLWLRAHHSDHPFWQDMDHLIQGDHYKDLQKEIAEDLLLAHLSAQTLPHSILLGSKYIPMWQVGAQYRRALTAGDIAFQRRWL